MANERDDTIVRPQPGALFLVATPIGNLGDLSPRARDILRDADLLLAEDTRHTAQLLVACGIERSPGTLESLHEHNERSRTPAVVARLAAETRTLVFYEAPHRLQASLEDLAHALGADRPAVVAREITKRFESVYRGTLGTLAARARDDPDMSRGEIVLVVEGAASDVAVAGSADVDALLRVLLSELPVAQAAKLAARITGRARKELYERALAIGSPER